MKYLGLGQPESAEDQAIHWLAALRSEAADTRLRGEFALWLHADPANKEAFDEITLLWHAAGDALARGGDTSEVERTAHSKPSDTAESNTAREAEARFIEGLFDNAGLPASNTSLAEVSTTKVPVKEAATPGSAELRDEAPVVAPPAVLVPESLPARPTRSTQTADFVRRARICRGSAFGLAASVLLTCAVMVLQLAETVYSTERGEQRRLVLADGTIAQLNTDTEIRLQYGDSTRKVRLIRGEVWFDIVKNPSRPFVVETRDLHATALGTAFAARQLAQSSRIGVSEGLVRVEPSTGAVPYIELSAGEQVSLQENAAAFSDIGKVDSLAWRSGQLVYENVSLGELLSDLGRYLPRQMVLSDDGMEDLKVSAVLNLQDQDAMLGALEIALPLRWKAVSDNLIIVTPVTRTRSR